MSTSRLAGMIGMIVGLVLVYAAYNMGERVIVGALPGGQPIFEHVTNKPMLGIGTILTAGSILIFAMSFVVKPSAREISETTDADGDENASAPASSPESEPEPSKTEME